MSSLKARHELFCRLFVEYANAAQAARGAGYRPSAARNTGYRLLRQPAIVRRITEIQAEMARAHCHDIDVLLGKLELVYRHAIDDHQFTAAARAVELQAKLSGLAVVRRPVSQARVAASRRDPRLAGALSAPEEADAGLPGDDAEVD
jgi:phage terminase small subunit